MLSTALASEKISQETETVERLAYFGLENNDNQDKERSAQFLQNPTGHEKTEISGYKVQDTERDKSDYDLKSLSVLEPAIQLIHQKTHDYDICDILPADKG